MGTLAVLLCMVLEQRATGIGLTSGLVVGLFSLWTVEATVKLLFNGGSAAGLKLAIGGLLKMPFLLAGLLGVAWASFNGHMNIFGVLGGVLLVHGTMLLTVVATAISAQESNTERYR
jgi:hypothetical protein